MIATFTPSTYLTLTSTISPVNVNSWVVTNTLGSFDSTKTFYTVGASGYYHITIQANISYADLTVANEITLQLYNNTTASIYPISTQLFTLANSLNSSTLNLSFDSYIANGTDLSVQFSIASTVNIIYCSFASWSLFQFS